MEFNVVEENGILDVKCKAEKIGNDIIIHAPNLKLVQELKHEYEKQKLLKDKQPNK